jgi:hypothetical protein
MMWVGSRRDQMGRFTVRPFALALGWATMAVMAVAALAKYEFLRSVADAETRLD